MKYPVYIPFVCENEKKYVNDCLDSNWISSKGKYISKFEKAFANYLHIKYAAGTCNGTVPIHLALLALGVKSGDEVIVPSFTYIASVNPIKWIGAKPVFVDSLDKTLQIDPKDIEKKITPKTKGVIIVHLYGHPCDMDAILKIIKKHHLFLIEDTAEAFGAKYKGKYVGTFGDIGTFSFFGNKTITTGEGGMAVTNNKTLFDKIVHLKGQGVCLEKEYWHDVVGYNYRMTNIAAAIGLAQLECADSIIAKKRKIAGWYNLYLSKNKHIRMLTEEKGVINSFWMITIVVDNANNRVLLRDKLRRNGIETRPAFYPAHVLPPYKSNIKLPVSENLSSCGINLPSHTYLTKKDVKFICDKINGFYEKRK